MRTSARRWINNSLQRLGYQIVYVRAQKEKEASRRPGLNDVFGFFSRWVSRFELDGESYGGPADYRTARVSMLNDSKLLELVDFAGKSVLEFGPLEGGNTILLEKLGARRVVAIEGQLENVVKCCVIKNLYRLDRSTFVFDNVKNVTLERYGRHDIAFVAGVLYHLDNPQVVLEQLSRITDQIVLSTHYAGDESPSAEAPVEEIRHNGKSYRGKLHRERVGPSAGLQRTSFWPFRDDLLGMLHDVGYGDVSVLRDSTDADTKFNLIYVVATRVHGSARTGA